MANEFNDPTPDAIRNRIIANVRDHEWSGPHALHHVTPRSVANESQFIAEVYGIERYRLRINAEENLIALPTHRADALATGFAQHLSNHPGYRLAISGIHDSLLTDYRNAISKTSDTGHFRPEGRIVHPEGPRARIVPQQRIRLLESFPGQVLVDMLFRGERGHSRRIRARARGGLRRSPWRVEGLGEGKDTACGMRKIAF